MSGSCFIGVDVGTGSARAGVFDASGTLLGVGKHPIQIWREAGDIVEQSSDDIWTAVCKSVRDAMSDAGLSGGSIGGIGFDAACSLVVLDETMRPLSISPSDDANRNVIVWMDHRAIDQTDRINAAGHAVLDYVGGVISPEMQTPKLLWLAENKPDSFASAGQFMDLADYLTWAASGSLNRSACTVTCKWTYLAHEDRWEASYFEEIGLATLAAEGFRRIGQTVVAPGTALGEGLTESAATALGLVAGTPVGAGLIDAHAGGVGTVGAAPVDVMGYVFGTSACTMTSSTEAKFVPGVWGPYFNAMVPGLWLNEGGQSAAGATIDHILTMHPAREEASSAAASAGMSLPDFLAREASRLATDATARQGLTSRHIVVPDFNGNRAPFADPHMRGIIAGLSLDRSVQDLIHLYAAAVAGIGYGLRQILDAQDSHGVHPKAVVLSGGAGEIDLVKQILADAARIPIHDSGTSEPVLLGAAMLGALASGQSATLTEAMRDMTSLGKRFEPENARHHRAQLDRFKRLQAALLDGRAS